MNVDMIYFSLAFGKQYTTFFKTNQCYVQYTINAWKLMKNIN